jgi:uncharacterized membrane protein YbhN (UPF0104 family)
MRCTTTIAILEPGVSPSPSPLRRYLKTLTALLLIIGVGYFFARELFRNWQVMSQFPVRWQPLYFGIAVAAIALYYLINTWCWRFVLSSLSGRAPLPFLDCIAVVNTSGLTKYLPGRLWSFALQMVWLERHGYSKAMVLYVNSLILLILLCMSSISGLLLLLGAGTMPLAVILLAIGGVLVIDGVLIFGGPAVLNAIVPAINRAFHGEVEKLRVSAATMIIVHVAFVLGTVAYGLTGYLVTRGLGFELAFTDSWAVMASMLLADVIGFVTLVSPGGLGVREGVMYYLLRAATNPALTLLLPIATRLVCMLVEVVLGALGMYMLRFVAPHDQRGTPTIEPIERPR